MVDIRTKYFVCCKTDDKWGMTLVKTDIVTPNYRRPFDYKNNGDLRIKYDLSFDHKYQAELCCEEFRVNDPDKIYKVFSGKVTTNTEYDIKF